MLFGLGLWSGCEELSANGCRLSSRLPESGHLLLLCKNLPLFQESTPLASCSLAILPKYNSVTHNYVGKYCKDAAKYVNVEPLLMTCTPLAILEHKFLFCNWGLTLKAPFFISGLCWGFWQEPARREPPSFAIFTYIFLPLLLVECECPSVLLRDCGGAGEEENREDAEGRAGGQR